MPESQGVPLLSNLESQFRFTIKYNRVCTRMCRRTCERDQKEKGESESVCDSTKKEKGINENVIKRIGKISSCEIN